MAELTTAAVLLAPRTFELADRPKPVAAPGQVVVRVAATAVCHTDLEIYTGRHPGVRYPVVMGHEAAGVVESVGAGVTRLQPGQRVLINPIIACGRCDACARGRGNLCRNAGLFGRELDGSLAEHVVLPESYLHPLPAHLTFDVATLIETLATVRHAQQRVRIAPGEAVVVLGQGATGLLHTAMAKLAGASPVIVVSRSGWKLELGRRMGADHVVDAVRGDPVADAVALTGGRGADVVIDAVGTAALVPAALEMLGPGGRLLLYSISHAPVERLATFPIYYKELTIYGSRALTADDFGPSIDLVASGAIALDDFISGRYPLTRVAAAFEDYERDPGRVLRLVIVPGT